MVFAILQMTFVSLVTISAEFMTIPASAETTLAARVGRHEHPHRPIRASVSSDTSIRVVRYEPVNVVTALAVMHFTLLGIMVGAVSALARRVGALSRKFCGMVGASCVVVRTIGAQAGRVGAQAGAISAVSVLV